LFGASALSCEGESTRAVSDAAVHDDASVAPSSDSAVALSCDELRNRGEVALNSITSSVGVSCQNDADCVSLPTLSCIDGCPTNAAYSRKDVSAVQGKVDALEQSFCATYAKEGCPPRFGPCTYRGIPACLLGRCAHDLSDSRDAGSSTCEGRVAQIENGLKHVASALDRACKTSDDCTTLLAEDDCFRGCPVTVSTAGASAFAVERASVDHALCEPYLADGCPPSEPFFCFGGLGKQECVGGECNDVSPSVPDAGYSCTQEQDGLKNQLNLGGNLVDKKCSADGDCSVVQLTTSCYESCTYAAASSNGADAFKKAISGLDAMVCPGFTKAGCSVQHATCNDAPPVATCSAGVCSLP